MKKYILSTLLLLMPLPSMAFQSAINVVVKDGSLQAGTTTGINISSGTILSLSSNNSTIQNLTVGAITSTGTSTAIINSSSGTIANFNATTVTVSNQFQSYNNSIIGTGLITGSTCAATSGGGLTIGTTYYWKVYAIPFVGNGSVGSQTGLTKMTMAANATQRTGSLSWNATTGANHYAITRHSGLTGGDGVLTSTVICSSFCTFVDTGQTLIAGNPWPSTPYGSTGSYFSSGILMNGNMPIVWNDYMTGSPLAYIGPTSAGEWVIKGGSGVAKNTVYLANSNDQNYWRFQQDPNDSSSVLDALIPGSNNDNHMKLIAGSSITFVVGNVEVVDISSQTSVITVHSGKQIGFNNASENAASSIYNGGASGQRELAFRVTAGTAAYFSDNGNFDLYVAAANTSPTTSSSVVQGRVGAVFISTPAYIHGSVTSTIAQAGYNGELIFTSSNTLSNTATTTAWTDVSTITLTPGHWRLTGVADVNQNGATCSQYGVAISSFSNNTTTDHVPNVNVFDDTCRGATFEWDYSTAPYDIQISANQRFFLKVEVNFSAGQPQKTGTIRAIRTD